MVMTEIDAEERVKASLYFFPFLPPLPQMLGRGLEMFRNICARIRERSGLRGSGMVRIGRKKCKGDGETRKKLNEMGKLFEN